MIRRRFRIKKVEVTDLAVLLALALGAVGAVYGFFFSVNALYFTNYIIEDIQSFSYSSNIIRLFLFILAVTTLHAMIFAVAGFIIGLIGGMLLNIAFRFTSGIRYLVEE